MKKLLGVLAVLALALPASADVLKNVDLVGEIQTIASDVRHNDIGLYNTGTSTRVLAGLSAELVEDVTANVLFQYANLWGEDEISGKNLDGYWDDVKVVQANVVLSNLFDCFEATVGRQFYGEEDSAVMYFGPNHYNAEFNGYTRSLDAAKLTYADDVKALTLIAGTVNEFSSKTLGTKKADIFGADFRLNVTDTLGLQVYGYDFRNNEDYDDANNGFYGAKATFNPEAVKLGVEYARNFAGHRLLKEGKDTGYMVKADAVINVKEVAVRGAFLYANENFVAIGNYTPGLLIGHKLGGDIYDYSPEGVRMFNLGFDVNPFEKWTFSLDGYAFQDRYARHAATWEADLTAKYTHNEYVQLFAGVGYAKYGNDVVGIATLPVTYKESLGKDNVKGQIGMLINF